MQNSHHTVSGCHSCPTNGRYLHTNVTFITSGRTVRTCSNGCLGPVSKTTIRRNTSLLLRAGIQNIKVDCNKPSYGRVSGVYPPSRLEFITQDINIYIKRQRQALHQHVIRNEVNAFWQRSVKEILLSDATQ